MNRPVSIGIVVLVVVAGLFGPMVLGGAAAERGDHGSPAVSAPSTTAVTASSDDIGSGDFDTTTFDITVHENGSATWTFRYELRLDEGDGSATQENFEAFAEEFESEETGMYVQFREQAVAMVDGNDQTDREMEASTFNRSATVDGQLNSMGVVEMSFQWDGFAETDDGAVVVGDVFQDLYITDDQSIAIQPGGDLEFQRAEPEPDYVGASLSDASSIQWSGEQEFLDGQPHAVLEEPDAGSTGDSGTLSDGTIAGDSPLPWALALFVLALGLAAGAVWYRRSSGDTVGSSSTATGPTDDSKDNPGTTTRDDTDEHATADPLSDEELLTDEDRVVTLIRENGGRMKQVNIVEETGWSKSKVSMLLSDMEEDGTISKLRVGRENIISLEGFEPEATKSPFDE
ncbi:helix-turn-helix transcriptional regulator [Natrarchaeobaculum sulfurireducens]|uniref:HTH iclR-type domain-containing protein n=1 Tax=Natrarchaeobaculum sulfurireducens TaxID=2044521 RepID=A0A346PDA9_9EURY|nr:hypothetical protein [Natrarchaeobaculum sulfurireducens]AXR77504.1 hypothetical protein AArc1_1164 [Natrarchaeobaculum sulfurireducens]